MFYIDRTIMINQTPKQIIPLIQRTQEEYGYYYSNKYFINNKGQCKAV